MLYFSVAILIFNKTRKRFVLVKQFRPGRVGGYLKLNFPQHDMALCSVVNLVFLMSSWLGMRIYK